MKKKYKITIIGPFPGPPKGISLSNDVVFNGLSKKNYIVNKIDTEHSDTIDSKFGVISFNKLWFLKSYLHSCKLLNSDLVYITTGITFFGVLKYAPFIILSKVLSKKTIIHIHSDHLKNEYKSLTGWKKKVFSKLIASFDSGIVLSESLRDNLTPFMKESQVFELYNFIQDELLVSEDMLLAKDFSEVKLFFLSNLIEEKGINILLMALKKLQDEGVAIKLKIAGNEVIGNDVSGLIKALHGAEYLGIIYGKAKQDLLCWGNVFCLPTYYSMEGQPISILEAMAFNNLILTTQHAGIPDICTEEHAVFCMKNDEHDLYLKIKQIIENWQQLQRTAISNGIYARERYTESRFIDRLDIILKSALEQ